MTVEIRRTECQIADWMTWLLAQHGFAESLYPIGETDMGSLTPIYDKNEAGTVVRTYIPEIALENMDSPRIAVLPFAMEQERTGRVLMEERYLIDVTVSQRLVGPPATRKRSREEQQDEWRKNVTRNGDRVLKISEDVQRHFEVKTRDWCRIEGCPGCDCARWVGVEANPIYEVAEIDGKHLVYCVQRHGWYTVRRICDCG